MNQNAKWMTVVMSAAAIAACGGDSSSYYDEGAVFYPGSETYSEWSENKFVDAGEENTSTFSIDVDTASFTLARQSLRSGTMPAPESVRTEEFINYFDFDYPVPAADAPFSINVEAGPSHFGATAAADDETVRQLVKIGLRGRHIEKADMKPINVVFLVDTSGSMSGEKLKIVMDALHTLTNHLRSSDTVGIVTYAGSERVLLEPTAKLQEQKIHRAINSLDDGSGGSTNAEAGIVKAFEMLESVKIEGGNNRVIILTDGDFNVGLSGEALVDKTTEYRERHMSLTCIGVGRGNYKDAQMEALSQNVNGNYFYLDSKEEGYRIFGDELASTLEVVAADVKIQIEFNAEVVERYRLLGYENRLLENADFDNDAKDAGEIGPDHRVTALYEVELAADAADTSLLAQVRLRYKGQYGEASQELLQDLKVANLAESFASTTADFQFAAAVAEFAEILRRSEYSRGEYADVRGVAEAISDDIVGAEELLSLVALAEAL